MPGHSWNTPAQREFFDQNLSVYHKAVKEGKRSIKRFWDTITSEFFQKFPLKAELVENESLDKRVLDDKYNLNADEAVVFKDAMTRRVTQIKTLFRYRHQKAYHSVDKPEADTGSKKSLTAAAKVFITKQRRTHHRSETFYRLNKDWLDPLIQKEMEDVVESEQSDGEEREKGEEGLEDEDKTVIAHKAEAKRKGWSLKVRGEVIKREMVNAPEGDLRAVEEAVALEKEQMRRASDLRLSGRGLAREPELRQESLDHINALLADNAKMYWDHAGMATITVGVAPDPSNPEKLRSRVVAYGRNAQGKVITDADPTLAGRIVKQLRAWGKTDLFTPERYATAAAEHAESVAKLDEDGEDDDAEQEDDAEEGQQQVLEYDDDKIEGETPQGAAPKGPRPVPRVISQGAPANVSSLAQPNASSPPKDQQKAVNTAGEDSSPRNVTSPGPTKHNVDHNRAKATTTVGKGSLSLDTESPSRTKRAGVGNGNGNMSQASIVDASFPGPMNLFDVDDNGVKTPTAQSAAPQGSTIDASFLGAMTPFDSLTKTTITSTLPACRDPAFKELANGRKTSTSARGAVKKGNHTSDNSSDSESDSDFNIDMDDEKEGDGRSREKSSNLEDALDAPRVEVEETQPEGGGGRKLWAGVISNVPDFGKGKGKTTEEGLKDTETAASEPTDGKQEKPKPKPKAKGGKAAAKTRKAAAKTKNTPTAKTKNTSTDSGPAGVVTAPADPDAGGPGDLPDPAQSTTRKRKAAPVTVPPTEEGRSKRSRSAVKFVDGTVFGGVGRAAKSSAPAVTKVKKGRK